MNRAAIKNSWLGLLAFFIFVIFTLKTAVFWKLGLTDDEAYYWVWAQHLDWNYFDHPPMTAWLIAGFERLFGTSPMSVRLPSVVISTITFVMMWKWCLRKYGSITARWVLVLFFLIPIFSLGSLMMVPDQPFILFFLATVMGVDRIAANVQNRKSVSLPYLITAFFMGLALLSKLTAVFLPLGVILYFALEPSLKPQLKRRPFYVAALVALILFLPVLVWNFNYGFPTFRFHLMDRQGGSFDFLRWLSFFGAQLIYLSPLFFIALFPALKNLWMHRKQPRQRLILCFSLPLLIVFTLQPLQSEFKAHWITPAVLLLLPEVVSWAMNRFKKMQNGWVITAVALMVVMNLVYFMSMFNPLIPQIHRATSSQPWEARYDVTNDLYGADEVRQYVQKLRKADKKKPFLSSHRYQVAAPLSFYLQEDVISLGPSSNQFEWFQSEKQIQSLMHQTTIFVTDNRYRREPHQSIKYKMCEELEPLQVYRGKELAREFYFWRCTDFQGPVNKPRAWAFTSSGKN